MDLIDKNASYNFGIAKAVAILLVFTGHFGTGVDFFWIPVALGLFVFGFSSAYFTSAKYHDSLRLGPFWRNKLYRLAPNVLVINAFLLALFLVEGRPGIWTLQTPVNVLGLTGFLNWFRLVNTSPFGAGLWFFTLLLLFYATYPILRRLSRSRPALYVTTCASLVAAVVLDHYVTMGHALWLSAWGFVFGVFVQRTGPGGKPVVSAAVGLVLAAAMLALNLALGVKTLNFYFIVAMSACAVLWLKDARLPAWPLRPFGVVSGIILEVYLIHSYLYVPPTGYAFVDYLLSLALVLVVARLLNRVASMIRRCLRSRLARVPA